MATKPKKPASYDLKAADRRRNVIIQVGLTAVVVIFAIALVLYIVTSGDKKPGGETKSVRVASSKLVNKDGTTEPKAVLSLYEDFLCPGVRAVRAAVRPDDQEPDRLRSRGHRLLHGGDPGPAVEPELLLAGLGSGLLRRRRGHHPDKEVFRRFHDALYAQQPSETGSVFPTNTQLLETTPQAGAFGKVPECINSGRYVNMADGLAAATNVTGTPTVRINGEDYKPTTPDALVPNVTTATGSLVPTPPASPVG